MAGLSMEEIFRSSYDSASGSLKTSAVGGAYVITAPIAGATVIIAPTTTLQIVNPAGTLATLTVTLPSTGLFDGKIVTISFQQIISALTLNGGTIVNPVTVTTAGQTIGYMYRTTGTTWYRVQ